MAITGIAGCLSDGQPDDDEPEVEDTTSESDEEDQEEEEVDDSDDRVTITVGPDGRHVFEPEEVTVTSGTEVTWVWDSDGHNINLTDAPGGGLSVQGTIEDEGYEDQHIFIRTGTFEYECEPHAPDMTGVIHVEHE